MIGGEKRANVEQAQANNTRQEDPTRAAEARERGSSPDKISPLYQPAPPGARIKGSKIGNPGALIA